MIQGQAVCFYFPLVVLIGHCNVSGYKGISAGRLFDKRSSEKFSFILKYFLNNKIMSYIRLHCLGNCNISSYIVLSGSLPRELCRCLHSRKQSRLARIPSQLVSNWPWWSLHGELTSSSKSSVFQYSVLSSDPLWTQFFPCLSPAQNIWSAGHSLCCLLS